MKRLILIITILILSSCQWIYDRGEDIVFPEIPHMGFKTIQEVMAYTSQIMYVSDSIHDCDEYWQSPDQTYIWQCGDCEDYSILAMYFLHHELGLNPFMVAGCCDAGWHTWVEVDGEWWEPQAACRCDNYQSSFTHIYTIRYAEVIYRSTHSHKALSEKESGRIN